MLHAAVYNSKPSIFVSFTRLKIYGCVFCLMFTTTKNPCMVCSFFLLFFFSCSRVPSASCFFFSFDYRLCCYFECWLHTHTHATRTHIYQHACTLLQRLLSRSLSLAARTKAFRSLTFRLKYIYILYPNRRYECGHACKAYTQ